MRKFNIMEYIYALKVNEKEENFFAFYSTLDKAKSAGKDWLEKTNKIWYNPITYVGMTCYELVPLSEVAPVALGSLRQSHRFVAQDFLLSEVASVASGSLM